MLQVFLIQAAGRPLEVGDAVDVGDGRAERCQLVRRQVAAAASTMTVPGGTDAAPGFQNPAKLAHFAGGSAPPGRKRPRRLLRRG